LDEASSLLSGAQARPFVPPPPVVISNSNGANNDNSVTDMFSPIKPSAPVPDDEPQTRFYMQNIRGGEQELQMPSSPPLQSSMDPAMSIYGGFAQAAPMGDVAKPLQMQQTIPGININAEVESNMASTNFQEMFSGAVPIEALRPEELVVPPSDNMKANRTWGAEETDADEERKNAAEIYAATAQGISATMQLEADMRKVHEKDKLDRLVKRQKEEKEADLAIRGIKQKQEERRLKYEAEDAAKLAKVSERSERALMKTRILATNPSKRLQTATSTTKLTQSIILTRSFLFFLH